MKKSSFWVVLALSIASLAWGSGRAHSNGLEPEDALLDSLTALQESELTFTDSLSEIGASLDALAAALEKRGNSKGTLRKLAQVRKARARVIRNFAKKLPPAAYAGDSKESAARAQNRDQRYTQFVQLSTQLMGELQNTERELVDILQTIKRDLDNFWSAYAAMRDNEFRTNERIMTIR